ncbi:hypothetical protein AMATHDRAFT_170014 [Amanita thiersii Skay4041]|uniref:Dihydrodipicolinate synthase n=1 Tax=Amanita thiersii Skay4041 TaxID=703135 RepID=A0A2A9NXQ1_9AGAR|nr:hypothetical protein AMATHDRAFT_170014 [Amanita thiersii Skay4041]
MTTNGVNGQQHVSRLLTPGVFAPIPTFFLPDTEDLDIPTFERHVTRLATAGIRPVIAGSMGEAIHLSQTERILLIQAARRALDKSGHETIPIIAGTGAGSTRETLELTKQAANAGADYAIVIASGYFAGVLAGNRPALKAFWREISEKSPIPVMIYNYPGASGGIDLDSDLIIELATECPNICGVKLTCGNVGKLTRIAGAVSSENFASMSPRRQTSAPFLVLGGYADFLLPSTFANAHGAITGLANIAPHTLVHLFELSQAAKQDPSILPKAQILQVIAANSDFTVNKGGISFTKAILERLYGYGGAPRRPLPPIEPDTFTALLEHHHTQALIKSERELTLKLRSE